MKTSLRDSLRNRIPSSSLNDCSVLAFSALTAELTSNLPNILRMRAAIITGVKTVIYQQPLTFPPNIQHNMPISAYDVKNQCMLAILQDFPGVCNYAKIKRNHPLEQ